MNSSVALALRALSRTLLRLGLLTRLLTRSLARLLPELLPRLLASLLLTWLLTWLLTGLLTGLLTLATIPVTRRSLSCGLILCELVEKAAIFGNSEAFANSTKDPLSSPELVADGHDTVVGDGACDVVRSLEGIFDAEEVAMLDLLADSVLRDCFDPAFFLL